MLPPDDERVILARIETKLDTVIEREADHEARIRVIEQHQGGDHEARLRDHEDRLRKVEGVDVDTLKETVQTLAAELGEMTAWRNRVIGMALGVGLVSGGVGSALAQAIGARL